MNMKKKRNFGDILVFILLLVALAMIALYSIIRLADIFTIRLVNLIEQMKTDSGLRRAMPVFALSLAIVTAVIYLMFRKKEGKGWQCLRYSLTAATGILLITGFVLMCFSIL